MAENNILKRWNKFGRLQQYVHMSITEVSMEKVFEIKTSL